MKKVSIWVKRLASKGSLKQFYAIYMVAFAVIALLAVLSQVFIQNYLGKQSEDSYLINVAGKQRMLSQKITKNLLLYTVEHDTLIKSTIEEDLSNWEKRHVLLSSGKLIKSNYNSQNILLDYQNLQKYFIEVRFCARQLLKNGHTNHLKVLIENEKPYLILMDEIVNKYDENYQWKLTKLRRIEFALSAVLVLVLVLEMFFVFIPLITMLSKTIKNLVKSEQSTKELARNLNQTNVHLKLKNKEINDVTLALDNAVILIKTDQFGKIIYANDKYCSLTKYSLKELIQKPLFYNNQGGAESIIYEHIKNETQNRKVWQNEVYDTASDASDFWLDVTIFPVINENGELYEFLVICNDITKRKLAEKELENINEQKFLKQEEEQKIKSKSIIHGQEVERRRMAVEVHDGLGQMLTALKFNCEALESEDDHQQMVIKNMKGLLQQVIVETRRISSDLLPTVLSDFGLEAALKEMVHSLANIKDITISYKNNNKLDYRLAHEKEIAVYRIVQESINNALKHSNADLIEVTISSDAEYFYASIDDNGVGIENEVQKGNKSGNGLRNMNERARLIEGSLYINSSKNKGTKVLLEIPID